MADNTVDIERPKLDPTCELFLKGDPTYRSVSPLGNYWLIWASPLTFAGAQMISNMAVGRPYYARMPYTIFAGAVGLFIGVYGRKLKNRWQSEKDVLYYHYMTLHPEDFQAPEKILYRDYLSKWTPIR